MCTLSFIPLEKGGFLFTHNRDEHPQRPFVAPQKNQLADPVIWSPKDEKAGGSWIAVSRNRIACILNGAFVKHERILPYKHSRGIVLNELYTYASFLEFVESYEFDGIENFTMICWDNGGLFSMVWDGKQIHLSKLDTKESHFFSSSTLYSPDQKAIRKQWFEDWNVLNANPAQKEVLNFHLTAGEDTPEMALKMHRGDYIETVCVSSISLNHGEMDFHFYDLLNATENHYQI